MKMMMVTCEDFVVSDGDDDYEELEEQIDEELIFSGSILSKSIVIKITFK